VLLSVAHSCTAHGVTDQSGIINEHDVSMRAAEQVWRTLHPNLPICVLDSGPRVAKGPNGYAAWKTERINAIKPSLAIELHCNSGPPARHYSEVIHGPSKEGTRAAQLIAAALKRRLDPDLFDSRGARPNAWPWPDEHPMFFIQDIHCPSIIVEGCFLTNEGHAQWLASDGGYESYGGIVAEGILEWWKTRSQQ